MKKGLRIICIAVFLGIFVSDKVEATESVKNNSAESSRVVTSVDAWMPDKNLQRVVAEDLGVEVSELTKELLQNSSVFVPYKGTVSKEYLSKYMEYDSELLEYYQTITDFTGLEYAKGVYLSIAATDQDDFKKVKVPAGVVLGNVNSAYALGNRINDIVDFYQTLADKFTFKEYFGIYLSQYHMFVGDSFAVTQDNYTKFTVDTKNYWRGVSGFSGLDNIEIDYLSDYNFFLEDGGVIYNYFGENIVDNNDSFLVYNTSIDDNYKVTFELDKEESTYSTDYADLKGKTTATDVFHTWREMNHLAALRDYQHASFKTAEGVQVSIGCYPQFLIPVTFK